MPGHVSLVGAGPGDPELLTRKAVARLRCADLVLYDALVDVRVLRFARRARHFFVGKRAGRHALAQTEINALLVRAARRGRRVVRLKGGDPFVFGRGGEEWLACIAAGVRVTVVPGLSSVIAGPAAAGIPLTHRGLAADFTVVSGHLDPGRPADEGIDWPGLAAHAGTLVLLMAMDRLELIAKALIEHGRSPATPSAVVQNATLPEQRVVRARLDQIAASAEREGVSAPAVVVIGAVVNVLPVESDQPASI
jgi:uroporphyrin-III C-methyltransferase